MFEKQKFPFYNKASLMKIASSHSLRCDSKQFEERFEKLDNLLNKNETFYLGELLPDPLIKGSQPVYIEGTEGVPVINTLSIQNMEINTKDCRYISDEDYTVVSENRKLILNDVLLTMDGGTSIGKAALFNKEGDFTVDSHVAILRPKGISPKALVYLLASPIGQLQFQRAESGASGQTSVIEEDLRRFKFPKSLLDKIGDIVEELDKKNNKIKRIKIKLQHQEKKIWEDFSFKALGIEETEN
ncbi:hypothetical protein [Peribacillus sp. JNUCC41]|uniref:hypothetical protein n=1 Tax=Peribacillus sp. JNUCC41 TaxID=2778370 RepID=UPI00178424AE|nr:hypothetical protein [Brevibacillus sp. JNUCC-41]QOS92058.1 hypothetical protein JNUCC41_10650 [Brevibacillus sp. JNUCC-41]